MKISHGMILVLLIPGLGVCLGRANCGSKPGSLAGLAPQILTEPGPRLPVQVKSGLPTGQRAFFPAYDGDGLHSFASAHPARRPTSRQILDKQIKPILKAIGFTDPDARLRLPGPRGRAMHHGQLRELAQQFCPDFPEKKFDAMCAVLKGKRQPNAALNAVFQNADNTTFPRFKADVEREEIHYFFPQVIDKVPLEHAGILAVWSRGRPKMLLTGRVLNRYRVANRVVLGKTEAVERVRPLMNAVAGLAVKADARPYLNELMLLQSGGAAGLPAIHYVYRMRFEVVWDDWVPTVAVVWLDAEHGRILKLSTLGARDKLMEAETYFRDPSYLPRKKRLSFAVNDPIQDGENGTPTCILKLDNVIDRIDVGVSGSYNEGEVEIPDCLLDGERLSLMDTSFGDPKDYCQWMTSTGFLQVNVFASVSRYRQIMLNAGFPPPFSFQANRHIKILLNPNQLEDRCNAWGGADFMAFQSLGCHGYTAPNCPDAPDVFLGDVKRLGAAPDNTVLAHEFAHGVNVRLFYNRDENWCDGIPLVGGSPEVPCPAPSQPFNIHDMADSYSHAFEETNCYGNWSHKNIGGTDANLNCAAHREDGSSHARLSAVDLPFLPGNPYDHFPEKRHVYGLRGSYSDMQIIGAGLWEVRQGMRGRYVPLGTIQHWTRFVRALRTYGWHMIERVDGPNGFMVYTDATQYRSFQDIFVKMAYQWLSGGDSSDTPLDFRHNGAASSNKLFAGFAKIGVFFLPPVCFDGDANTADPGFCPGGEYGGVAVIDIDDNDPGDDQEHDGVVRPEGDYLVRGGAAPVFHVWTGPRYLFDAEDFTRFPDEAPCNDEFKVIIANDESLELHRRESEWIRVNLNNDGTPQCYATWSPNESDWREPSRGGERLYYRVLTGRAGEKRFSDRPGNDFYRLPLPYAIINETGRP